MKMVMKNVHKSFGDVKVLQGAGVSVDDGEIHALIGENGAGKSTLMKILTGVYTKDSGEITIDGNIVDIRKIKDSEKLGISIIHQELNIMPEMSLVDNLFLGHEQRNGIGILKVESMKKQAAEALKKLGLDISPMVIAKDLTVGQLQLVEIARALMRDAKLIIMDEPTSALTDREIEQLFITIRQLKATGVSFIYISHRMEELFALCDKVTVMRDGAFIAEKAINETDFDEIVSMMVGRQLGERFPNRNNTLGRTVLEVEGVSFGTKYRDITFDLKEGEVLGFAGLMGSGRTEIMHGLFGSVPFEKGCLKLNGQVMTINNPQKAMKEGIAFVTEDRKQEGLFLNFSVAFNMYAANFEKLSNKGLLDEAETKKYVAEGIERFRVKTASSQLEIKHLSGGNQQKVILSKWLGRNPKVLILDEPTRGVDVGAKKEIYDIIAQLASEGMAIIMVSSELPEIIGLCDRIAVMRDGRLMGILNNKESFTQENIMSLATGGQIQ